MINLYQLQSFVTVIAEGSMTAAADKLFLTQPAISQQIRNLEEELGSELLVRGTRQVTPTLQGEVLCDFAKRILQLGHQAEVAVKTLGTKLTGSLKVGTLNSLGVQLMSPIIGRLLKHNPQLSVTIDYAQAEDLIKAFRKGDLDVLILPEIEKQYGINLPDAEKNFLMREEMWLVASGKDTEVSRQATVPDLAGYPLILFTKEYPDFQKLLTQALEKHSMSVRPVFESPNVGTLKRVIESGLGWGFLPATSIRKQVRAGRLTHVHMKELDYNVEFFYYSRKNSTNKDIQKVFYQVLQQQDQA